MGWGQDLFLAGLALEGVRFLGGSRLMGLGGSPETNLRVEGSKWLDRTFAMLGS